MKYLRAFIALLVGVVVGSLVNLALIQVGGHLVPPPSGIDPADTESLRAGMHLFEPRHFLFPWLAHALGTFTGALLAAWIAREYRMILAMIVGCVFLAGGIAAAVLLPAPIWFIVVDLGLAYLPMAWLAARIAAGRRPNPPID